MSQEIRKILATNIEKYRTSKKLSREELSLILGVDNSYISKLEKGRINITIDKIEQLANYFKIDTYKLFKN
ncbi:MAG: helix-turn-helix domain-containing protein [bacterium]|nr:helix-turn-helix domain-containing protein [bacterium]